MAKLFVVCAALLCAIVCCNAEVEWEVTDQRVLRIYGSGDMEDYVGSDQPWKDKTSDFDQVLIEGGVESVGNYAFSSFENIGSVTVKANLKRVGQYSFSSCTSLNTFTLDGGVIQNIEDNAFSGLSALTKISFSGFNGTIGEFAFSSSSLKTVTISGKIDSVGTKAFNDCGDLSSVNLGLVKGPVYSYAFSSCSKLSSVRISGEVTEIGDYAFDGCESLKDVSLGLNGPFGQYSFGGCTNLTSLTIEGLLTDINSPAFPDSKNVSLTIRGWNGEVGGVFYDLSVRSVTVEGLIVDGKRVTSIGEQAFKDQSNLESVSLSDLNGEIGNSAFSGCSSLSDLSISGNITSIGDYAFQNCYNVGSFRVPGTCKTIGASAFEGCTGLVNLTINGGVETIRQKAFSGCSSMKFLIIPPTVKYVYSEAFASCTSLTTVLYHGTRDPDQTTEDHDQFEGCYKFERVLVPQGYKDRKFCGRFVKRIDFASGASTNSVVRGIMFAAVLLSLALAQW